jgi:hypothetical protein
LGNQEQRSERFHMEDIDFTVFLQAPAQLSFLSEMQYPTIAA